MALAGPRLLALTPLSRLALHHQCRAACFAHARLMQFSFAKVQWNRGNSGTTKKHCESADPVDSPNARPAGELSQNISEEETSHYERLEQHSKEAQRKSPWTREGSDIAPVEKRHERLRGMVKGQLLTTPSRMLKLILPLTRLDQDSEREEEKQEQKEKQKEIKLQKGEVEPLALFVHPQQPLSYLERLIQSELPPVQDKHGNDKTPSVVFRAADTGADVAECEDDDESEYMRIDGKMQKTGRMNKASNKGEGATSGGNGESDTRRINEPHPDYKDNRFIRWSPSTEIGDFIRDASRTNVFLVSIEGSARPIPVAVPSFAERTFYLRMRLRKVAGRIADMAKVKDSCDRLARQGAKRVAQLGFCGLVGWWYLVYRLTFETSLGWDVMEPVTYLVGLSGLIGGYTWFLYHNREASYRSAMQLTVSRRQQKLYEASGFDVGRWEGLVDEANRLRREVKLVADEYDVDWDEAAEAGEDVSEALRKERRREKRKGRKGKDDEEGDGDVDGD